MNDLQVIKLLVVAIFGALIIFLTIRKVARAADTDIGAGENTENGVVNAEITEEDLPEGFISFLYQLDSITLRFERTEGIWTSFLVVGSVETTTGISDACIETAMFESLRSLTVTQKQSVFEIDNLIVTPA